MTIIIAPTEPFVYRYNGVEGTEPITVDGTTVVSLVVGDDVTLTTQTMSSTYEVYLLATFDSGAIITEEKQIWLNIRSSEVPSNFDAYEMYFEDGNGNTATYKLSDNDMGATERLLMSALVKDKSFNPSYVTRMGVHVKGCKTSVTNFTLVLTKFSLTNSPTPHYAQPQEVIDFLGVRNNDGTQLVLDEASIPSYDAVADLIVQGENAIEQETRTAWTERRTVNEIRNTASTSWTNSPFNGLFQPSSQYSPTTTFFRGVFCQLIHKDIKDIDASKGDKLEIRWYGDNWVDITSGGSFWMDNPKGVVYIRQWFFQRDASVRATYRYGRDEVPADMKLAAILFASKRILESGNLYRYLFPENPESGDRWMKTAYSYQMEFDRLVRARADQTIIGGI